jgi:hypothetical protein
MGELLTVPSALGTFGLALLIFGFAPGMVLAVIVRMIPDPDRRRELQAELYEVPRWDRPFWVAQQLEVAIRVGLFPEIEWLWGRHVWHRCKIMSGLENHRRWPESFWVPEDDVKEHIRPGDRVKLMWSVRRSPGERMWVTVTKRAGERLVGTLDSWAVVAYLHPGETVKFHIDDIIDYVWEDEDETAEPAAAG